jgi:hypothetical protein
MPQDLRLVAEVFFHIRVMVRMVGKEIEQQAMLGDRPAAPRSRSCHEESSRTGCRSGVSRQESGLTQLFPAASAGIPAASSRCATRWVVVLLPLVPVIPTGPQTALREEEQRLGDRRPVGAGQLEQGMVGRMPGFLITMSASRKSVASCAPAGR